MKRILISACLAGDRVRYDGKIAPLDHPLIRKWKAQGRLVQFCPEVAGGLAIPRPPAEIVREDTDFLKNHFSVKTVHGKDVTAEFKKGARLARELALRENIELALLKEKSPSCGTHFIYDGRFSRTLIPGAGITAMTLRQAGIHVFSESELDPADAFLNRILEESPPKA